MSDLRKIVAKEMSKSNGKAKVMRGNVFNINILDEWIKWLSYESVEDKKIRDSICEFYDTLFNEDNYPKLSKYFDLNRMRDLFIRYNEGDVSDEEYLEVVAYMGEDIFELMDYKLTSDKKKK